MSTDPLERTKQQYSSVIEKIKSDTSVGIDAQYTHAIIIQFLRDITTRLDHLEKKLENFNR